MTRPRDTQREKLYRAERSVFGATPADRDEMFASVEQVQSYVNYVTGTAFFRKHFPLPYWTAGSTRITVDDGRSRRRGGARFSSITLPRACRSKSYILHEIAHVVTLRPKSGPVASHGREYAANLLKLVSYYLGRETHDKLRAAFREHGVRYKPKRVLSPETIAKLRERGKLLAASRTPGVR